MRLGKGSCGPSGTVWCPPLLWLCAGVLGNVTAPGGPSQAWEAVSRQAGIRRAGSGVGQAMRLEHPPGPQMAGHLVLVGWTVTRWS